MKRLGLLVGILLVAACTAPGDGADDGGEVDQAEGAVVPITQADETAPASALAAAPLDKDATDLIDLRGVGDSGWSKTHESTPISAAFGAALDRFDPSGKGYRGDLSFINWETVVGSQCTTFGNTYKAGASYAFVSRPENLIQASERGFDLFALSNNHARDCYASSETSLTGEPASSDMTGKSFERLGDRDWLWAGVAGTREDDSAKAKVRTFHVKGRDVKVAFGSVYMGRPDCPRAACKGDIPALFASLRDADADLRIVSMHSMGPTDQDELVKRGVEFVEKYNGDVVFGQGPHVWKPVRVVRKDGGGTGVVFESLGNFLHPALGAQAKNFIGRALFDARTLKLRQVQLLPVANSGMDVRWSSADAAQVESNLRWTPTQRGVYANVKP